MNVRFAIGCFWPKYIGILIYEGESSLVFIKILSIPHAHVQFGAKLDHSIEKWLYGHLAWNGTICYF